MKCFIYHFNNSFVRDLAHILQGEQLRGAIHGEFHPGLKYCGKQITNSCHLVSEKTTSLRMLTLLSQPGLKFHLDYMDFLPIFDPFARTENPNLGPVSRKSRQLFGPETPVVKLESTCLGSLLLNLCLMEEKPRG